VSRTVNLILRIIFSAALPVPRMESGKCPHNLTCGNIGKISFLPRNPYYHACSVQSASVVTMDVGVILCIRYTALNSYIVSNHIQQTSQCTCPKDAPTHCILLKAQVIWNAYAPCVTDPLPRTEGTIYLPNAWEMVSHGHFAQCKVDTICENDTGPFPC
jgi:hypothetical protein